MFQCPISQEACLAEPQPTHHNESNAQEISANRTCEPGYEGILCAQCTPDTHTRSMRECKVCKEATRESAIFTTLSSISAVLVLATLKWWAKKDRRLLKVLAIMIPDLLCDLKVFVGLYVLRPIYVMCNPNPSSYPCVWVHV